MKSVNLSCAGDNANTGIQSCSWTPSNITGAILIPANKTYTVADVATLWTTLQADTVDDVASNRIYPIGAFKAIEDKSSDVQIESDGYGGKSFVRDGDYEWMFEYKNGFCFYQKLRTFHTKNTSFNVLFIDEVNNTLWGTEDANGDLAGFSLELLIVPNIKINTGSNSTKYYVSFGLSDPTEMNDNTYTVSFPNNQKLMKLAGLKDITITATTTNGTSGVVTLTANSSCGAEDLVALYPTEIVDTTIFQVNNDTTGVPVTITSASIIAGKIALVTDATDHAPGNILSIYLGEVSDLDAAGITGFASSNTVTSLVV
jgi:hypothetical protein